MRISPYFILQQVSIVKYFHFDSILTLGQSKLSWKSYCSTKNDSLYPPNDYIILINKHLWSLLNPKLFIFLFTLISDKNMSQSITIETITITRPLKVRFSLSLFYFCQFPKNKNKSLYFSRFIFSCYYGFLSKRAMRYDP